MQHFEMLLRQGKGLSPIADFELPMVPPSVSASAMNAVFFGGCAVCWAFFFCCMLWYAQLILNLVCINLWYPLVNMFVFGLCALRWGKAPGEPPGNPFEKASF